MQKLTDQQMLQAATTRLAEHRALRPASHAEAVEIAAKHRRSQSAYEAIIAALRGIRSLTAAARVAIVGRGPQCIALQHLDSLDAAERSRRAGSLESVVLHERMAAEAWELVAAGPDGAAYAETERELVSRVQYYSALVVHTEYTTFASER